MNRANPARVAAARALCAVDDGAFAEDVLAEFAPPTDPDRSLAWFLALGVLRRRGHVDAALRPHLRDPIGGMDAAVRAALRIGAFELLFARTPPHAAVNEAVEVVRAAGLGRAQGLVNAVLRRVQPEAPRGAEALDAPIWLWARWGTRFGRDAADRWLRDAGHPPPLFVALRQGFDAATWREAGLDVVDTDVAQVVELRGAGRVEALPGFADGRFWVQDLAAARVTDLVDVAPGGTVLDACAAPGGKTFRLADRGVDVLAVDRSDARLRRVTDGARRLGLDVAVRQHDWDRGPMPGRDPFDAVLVDAPCTALGTIRRNPEVKWRRQLVDVMKQPETQLRVTEAAAVHVRPGGALVYAVCSPEPEEGDGVVRAFVERHPEFSVETTLSTAPPERGEDGFFGARLRRSTAT
jgi:16S rRNA (cytosine967-C5)-methyltransferase